MPRAEGLADALHARGLDVVEHRGWETRGSASFQPGGVVCHHTGPGSVEGLIRLVISGRSDLDGPLCQVLLAPDGVCHLIAAGKANHAGPGGWRGLSGNSRVFGIEAVHPGSPAVPWPTIQLDAYVECAAGMLDLAGADSEMCCGHKEWATPHGRKIDPILIDMNSFRGRVADASSPPSREVIVVVNAPPVALLMHPSWPKGSYVVVCADGGAFAFGGPPWPNWSLANIRLNAPIVAAEVTPSGQGCKMLGQDGGDFNFGDAEGHGRVEYTGPPG